LLFLTVPQSDLDAIPTTTLSPPLRTVHMFSAKMPRQSRAMKKHPPKYRPGIAQVDVLQGLCEG
jgi:hypothetical protein